MYIIFSFIIIPTLNLIVIFTPFSTSSISLVNIDYSAVGTVYAIKQRPTERIVALLATFFAPCVTSLYSRLHIVSIPIGSNELDNRKSRRKKGTYWSIIKSTNNSNDNYLWLWRIRCVFPPSSDMFRRGILPFCIRIDTALV